MKTLIFSLVLVLAATFTHAQGIIELNETRVDYSPLFSEMTNHGNMYIMKVRENHSGEFEKDPLSFLNKNFDAKQFIAHVKDKRYDSYQVSFKSNKGELKAEYDRQGNLDYVSHRFKNITLPYALTQKVFLENEGWSVVKNMHIAYGKNGKMDKSYYKITMKNGNKKKNLKIDAAPGERFAVLTRF